jgi:hypothetical protein
MKTLFIILIIALSQGQTKAADVTIPPPATGEQLTRSTLVYCQMAQPTFAAPTAAQNAKIAVDTLKCLANGGPPKKSDMKVEPATIPPPPVK